MWRKNASLKILVWSLLVSSFELKPIGLPISDDTSTQLPKSYDLRNLLKVLQNIGSFGSSTVEDPGGNGTAAIPRSSRQNELHVDYTLEMLPSESESLKPGEWIYFRLCTLPKRTHHSSLGHNFETALRHELIHRTCVRQDLKRPNFPRNQLLIVSTRNQSIFTYHLNSMELNGTSGVIGKDQLKFWPFESNHTLLFAMKPSSRLENTLIDVHLELQNDSAPSLNVQGQTTSQADKRIHLERFLVRFLEQRNRLHFACNKTGPIVMFNPVISTRERINGDKSSLNDHSDGRDILEPVVINQLMNEQAIQTAQHKLWLFFTEHSTQFITKLSEPSEPAADTPIIIVQLGEALKVTCQGHIEHLPLRVIYDSNVWEGLSHQDVANDTVGSAELILKAMEITMTDPTLTLESVDHVTSIKCGSYHRNQSHIVPDPPVEELFFLVVHPHVPFKPPRRLAQVPDLQSNTKQVREETVGFWNISLSRLSIAKLITSIMLVVLIVSLILITICHSSHAAGSSEVTSQSSSEIVPTWNSGDNLNVVTQQAWSRTSCSSFKPFQRPPQQTNEDLDSFQDEGTAGQAQLIDGPTDDDDDDEFNLTKRRVAR